MLTGWSAMVRKTLMVSRTAMRGGAVSPGVGCWLYTLNRIGRKFFAKRPTSAFSSSVGKMTSVKHHHAVNATVQ